MEKLRKILRTFQPNLQHYVKTIEAQSKKWFSYIKNVQCVKYDFAAPLTFIEADKINTFGRSES